MDSNKTSNEISTVSFIAVAFGTKDSTQKTYGLYPGVAINQRHVLLSIRSVSKKVGDQHKFMTTGRTKVIFSHSYWRVSYAFSKLYLGYELTVSL